MTRLSFAPRLFAPRIVAPLAMLVLAACGGGRDPASPVVQPVTITAVAVSPSTSALVVGENATLTMAVTTSNGANTTTLSPAWTSSAPGVATVAQDGKVVAVGAGTTTITASVGGKSGSASVTVLSVTAVSIAPASATLIEDDVRDLVATATLSNGTSGARTAAWTSSAPTVLSVSNTGRITALTAGTANITASIAGTGGVAAITVGRRVATVALNIVARALTTGETVTLVPTLKFSDSSAATGKTVVWASSATSVATVSASGLVTALSAGTTNITATVDGRVATSIITVRAPATTSLNTAAATTASIGPTGGVLTTSASGVSFRLEIPAGALRTNVSIRMTPITAIGNLPLSGGLVAAVDLQPSGLVFAKSAVLRVGTAAPARTGLALTGFSMKDNGGKVAQTFATARTKEVQVLVSHFSAAGAAFGTTQEVASILPSLDGRPPVAETFFQTFTSLATSGSSSAGPALLQALIGWFDNGVLPQLQAANTDDALVAALAEYDGWAVQSFAFYSPLPLSENDIALTTRRLQFRNALEPKLLAAMQQNNQVCKSERSLVAMQNTLFWQVQAEAFGVANGALTRANVLGALCVQVAMISKTFPDPVQAGFPNDLDATFGVQFGPSGVATSQPVTVFFSGPGLTFGKSSPTGSDAQGAFSVAVTAQGNTAFGVSMLACLTVPGATDVCGVHAVTSTSLDVTGNYTGRFSSRIVTPTGVSFPVNVPLNVRLVQNQNGVSGTYQVMQFNGPRGSVSATLSSNQLLNFTLNQFAPCLGVLTGAATFTLATRSITSSYGGADCTGTHNNGQSDLVPGTVALSDFEGAWTNGFSASGFPNLQWRITQNGTQVLLSYAAFDSNANRMQCLARFRGTVTAGSEVFTATLTANVGSSTLFPSGSRVSWSPDLVRQRAAVLTYTEPGSAGTPAGSWFLTTTVPPGCDP